MGWWTAIALQNLLAIVRFVTVCFEAQNRFVIIHLVIVHFVTVFVL